jgi:DNA mismatch repair protein MutS2
MPLAGTPDVRPHLEAVRVEQHALPAASLLELARLVRTSEEVGSELKEHVSELTRLPQMAGRLPDLGSLRDAIEKAIDRETGEVKDDASPLLRTLRARLFKLRRRLESILESYFKQKDSRKMLQEQIITVRNGRSVLPVRAECKGQMVGIVHGSSASGATVFIEPLSTVEINNEIVSVEEQEAQEIHRILLSLSEMARAQSPEISETVDILAELDLIQAKAMLSEALDGTEPKLNQGKSLDLVSARHPFLIRKIVERIDQPLPPLPTREPVPVSFKVDEHRSALVFTGPNTGGKTVALKTAGLLSLMAQAGLHVPAHPDSSVPVFKQIFADIGDEQSIGSSLSTFSSHLRNIVEMERDLEPPSLVLLDEVGTGTDPAEGGALGTALVEHFRRRGALVLASTHHGMLKAYASTSPGVGSASFEFDPETYEPTYRLVEDSTGRSLALEIARRFGLPEEVISHARELQNQKERQVEDLLEQLEAEGQQLARDREELLRERRQVESSLRRQRAMEQQYDQSREERLKNFRAGLEEDAARARVELRQILDEARERSRAEGEASAPDAVKDVGERLEELAARFQPPADAPTAPPLDVDIGKSVTISSLQLTGKVVEILGAGEVEVMVRDKKLRIAVSDLEADHSVPHPPLPATYAPHTQIPHTKHVPHELNVIGCTVDEAISQADKFLDDAFLCDHRKVRLIHGLGRGRLKKAIAEWLATHPHVASHQSEGSGAVTVVELKN